MQAVYRTPCTQRLAHEKQLINIRRGLENLKLKLAGEKSELIKSLDEFIGESTKANLA